MTLLLFVRLAQPLPNQPPRTGAGLGWAVWSPGASSGFLRRDLRLWLPSSSARRGVAREKMGSWHLARRASGVRCVPDCPGHPILTQAKLRFGPRVRTVTGGDDPTRPQPQELQGSAPASLASGHTGRQLWASPSTGRAGARGPAPLPLPRPGAVGAGA